MAAWMRVGRLLYIFGTEVARLSNFRDCSKLPLWRPFPSGRKYYDSIALTIESLRGRRASGPH